MVRHDIMAKKYRERETSPEEKEKKRMELDRES